MPAYYNENNPEAAAWTRECIASGLIAAGDVDERSIADVRADELDGYEQCHFFAGIGGWSCALRLAGWPDDRPVWTGSCPCQPFSQAGRMGRFTDDRHVWPTWVRLIEKRKPSVVFGEQVASATEWLRLVRGDLEALDYAVGAMPIEAASAGADHLRDRFWFVAHSDDARLQGRPLSAERPGERAARPDGVVNAAGVGWGEGRPEHEIWSGRPAAAGTGGTELDWAIGADGKARRVKPGVRLLVDGFPCRVGLLRGFGNAIDPRPASAFIAAASDAILMDRGND